MRILMIPASTLKNHDKDSMYLQMKDFAEWMVQNAEEPVYFYWLLEGEQSLKELQRSNEVFWKYGQLISYPSRSDDFYDKQYLLPGGKIYEMFNRREGKYPVDAVMMVPAGVATWVKRWLLDLRRRWMDPPVFIPNPQVMNFEHEWFKSMNQYERFMVSVGYSDVNQFVLSEEEKRQVMMNVRKFIAPSKVRKTYQNTQVMPMGIRTDLIDQILEESPGKYDKFTFFYGGRFNKVKNVDRIVEWFDKIYARRDVNIVMTTNSDETRQFDPKDYDHFNIHWSQNRDEYLRKACRAHVAVCATNYESFGAAFFEQLYAGTIVLFPDKKWVDSLFGGRDYPFKYKGSREALKMMMYVMDNYEKCKEEIAWTKDFIRDRLSSEMVFEEYYSAIREAVHDEWANRDSIGQGNIELLDQAVDMLGDEFSFEQVDSLVHKFSDTFDWSTGLRAATMSRFEAYRYIKDGLGYIETCERPIPDFRKNGDS